MPQYMVVNPTEVTLDVLIESADGTQKDTVSIQPRGRPKIAEGWKVSQQSLLQHPQIKVYDVSPKQEEAKPADGDE